MGVQRRVLLDGDVAGDGYPQSRSRLLLPGIVRNDAADVDEGACAKTHVCRDDAVGADHVDRIDLVVGSNPGGRVDQSGGRETPLDSLMLDAVTGVARADPN